MRVLIAASSVICKVGAFEMIDINEPLESHWQAAELAENAGKPDDSEQILIETVALCVSRGDVAGCIATYASLALMFDRQGRHGDAATARRMTQALASINRAAH